MARGGLSGPQPSVLRIRVIVQMQRFGSSKLGISAHRSIRAGCMKREGALMAKAKPRSDSRRATKDQQGPRGRLTTNAARQPILAPRVSKVPAQDSDFLTTA